MNQGLVPAPAGFQGPGPPPILVVGTGILAVGFCFVVNAINLVDVIHSAGTVFENLQCSRAATQSFIAGGDTSGITSRADLELLKDLSDAAQIITRAHNSHEQLTPQTIIAINQAMTRSAALQPGVFRSDSDNIGVATRYGDHRPKAATEADLHSIITEARNQPADKAAAALFVLLAKAQPFGDGNKRTALLAANLLLLPERKILTVPYSDQDLSVSETFNDLLARAYIYDDVAACVEYLVREGVSTL